jgi:hypothetical protein
LVAANIPVGSMVAAAMVTIATERERQRYAQQLSGARSGELFSARRGLQC